MGGLIAILNIPDAIYERLAKHAAAIGITVEELVMPLLDQAAPQEQRAVDRQAAFAKLTALINSVSPVHSADDILDDSREAMYEEQLRRQL